MNAMAVVETGILGLLCVEVAVKGVYLLTDFENKVSVQKRVEMLRISRARFREHVLIHELVDGSTLHLDERRWGDRSSMLELCAVKEKRQP
jgi:hypothetical protein